MTFALLIFTTQPSPSLFTSIEKALAVINQIRELLPKDQNGGGQGQQNQRQDQNQPQERQNQEPQGQKNDSQKDQPTEQRQEQDPQQNQPPEPEEDEEPEPSKDDQELEATLKKAQERNDEHEAEKKARMRKAPLPPNERDW